ncbi:hypothetical protein DPMN_116378 [Dreissena polymorpha]|uniref:Uncharacterized protein n=1 Tax=Dreissena polymorpha TaxID=45954 RepID=A0A9D4KNR4_DREPO|nr:hypothetical protein DPMN_116378 [Dreissena polymorpha]
MNCADSRGNLKCTKWISPVLNYETGQRTNMRGNFKCGNRILKAFANSLDPDETSQNMASHRDPNCLLF